MPDYLIRPLVSNDCEQVRVRMIEAWGAETVVAHGTLYRPHMLPGLGAFNGREMLGILTYDITGSDCEIITLNSWQPGIGIGSALIERSIQAARESGCKRLWLVTTNDNTHALRFYQRRGFYISAIRIDTMASARLLKPEIPMTGEDGIPIRDEIELEIQF